MVAVLAAPSAEAQEPTSAEAPEASSATGRGSADRQEAGSAYGREVWAERARGGVGLAQTAPNVLGDLLGATGLIGAAGLATLGDTVALLDGNAVGRGLLSGGIHRAAEGISWGGTTGLEWLRGEDVERWPEAPAAYRRARPFRGRLDTALSGGAALRVAVVDALLGPAGGLLRVAGATSAADVVDRRRRESGRFAFGPPPADLGP